MAREEEEKEEAMCLTYDRPELVNKVVFRRSKTTGTWEVVMPTPPLIDKQASQTSNPNSIGKNVGRKGKREEAGSSRSRDFKHTALDKREESGKEIEKETGSCGGGTLPSKTAKQRRSNPGSVEVDDPDYSPNKQRHRRTRSNHRSNVTASAITVDSDRSPSLGIKSTPPNHLKGVIVSASPPSHSCRRNERCNGPYDQSLLIPNPLLSLTTFLLFRTTARLDTRLRGLVLSTPSEIRADVL